MAPRAKPINRCGTFGSLRVVKTTGVRYVRTVGDGRQGRWVVKASARKGYRLAAGSPRRFSGNLGKFYPCPGDPTIESVTTTATGDPTTDPWDVTVATDVPGARSRDLAVTYVFDTEVRVEDGSAGEGWDCPEGGEVNPVAAWTELTCTFDYEGQAPPAVTLTVVALREGDEHVRPQGTVSLAANGTVTDTDFF